MEDTKNTQKTAEKTVATAETSDLNDIADIIGEGIPELQSGGEDDPEEVYMIFRDMVKVERSRYEELVKNEAEYEALLRTIAGEEKLKYSRIALIANYIAGDKYPNQQKGEAEDVQQSCDARQDNAGSGTENDTYRCFRPFVQHRG